MLAAPPDGQGHAPFPQTGTEIFGAVNRVQNSDPACAQLLARNPAFFTDEIQPREGGCQQIVQFLFQKRVRFCHWAAIGFPGDLIAAFLQFGKQFNDQRLHARQHGCCWIIGPSWAVFHGATCLLCRLDDDKRPVGHAALGGEERPKHSLLPYYVWVPNSDTGPVFSTYKLEIVSSELDLSRFASIFGLARIRANACAHEWGEATGT